MAASSSTPCVLFLVLASACGANAGPGGSVCQHSGHAATHQAGVKRHKETTEGVTLLLDGNDVQGWGRLCAEACCDAGPNSCRFWSVYNGTCTHFARYAAPQAVVGPSAPLTVSGTVYHGNSLLNNVSGDYASLKGFNYFPAASMNDIDMWRDYDEAAVERELGWAAKAGFNFCRAWFNFVVWEAEGTSPSNFLTATVLLFLNLLGTS
eukprot:COSAG05_NODE_838_length_7045_cov_19.123956_4_plen_208_part_00